MPRIFAVTRSRGPQWNSTQSMDEQQGWREHAAFMNGLHADGFVLIGGPLEGTADVLLIVKAETADEITARLSDDCWSKSEILSLGRILPWRIRLGSLD